MKLERRIRKEGCTIRALEYAFGVSATTDECALRLEQIDTMNEFIKRMEEQVESEEQRLKLSQFVIVYDGRFWQAMLDTFRTNRTPLGRALRAHHHKRRVMSEPRLLQAVTHRKQKVIGHMQLLEGGHTAYLGIAGGKLIRISDQNAQVPSARLNTDFMVDVFTPK